MLRLHGYICHGARVQYTYVIIIMHPDVAQNNGRNTVQVCHNGVYYEFESGQTTAQGLIGHLSINATRAAMAGE